MIVAGGTQAGKTTPLNCLASAVRGRERVITCEEVFELPQSGPNRTLLKLTTISPLRAFPYVPGRQWRRSSRACRVTCIRGSSARWKSDPLVVLTLELQNATPGMEYSGPGALVVKFNDNEEISEFWHCAPEHHPGRVPRVRPFQAEA